MTLDECIVLEELSSIMDVDGISGQEVDYNQGVYSASFSVVLCKAETDEAFSHAESHREQLREDFCRENPWAKDELWDNRGFNMAEWAREWVRKHSA